MLRNFTFLIAGKLAGCAHPGWDNDLRAALAELTSCHDISAIVTLDASPLPDELLAEYGLKGLHAPVRDFDVPSVEAATRAVDFIRGEIESGGRVAVHCNAGYGRTGTVLACYLVGEGLSAREAIERVRALRPGSIETSGQEDFVRRWAQLRAQPESENQG